MPLRVISPKTLLGTAQSTSSVRRLRALILDSGRIADNVVRLPCSRTRDDHGLGPLRRQLLDRLGVPARP